MHGAPSPSRPSARLHYVNQLSFVHTCMTGGRSSSHLRHPCQVVAQSRRHTPVHALTNHRALLPAPVTQNQVKVSFFVRFSPRMGTSKSAPSSLASAPLELRLNSLSKDLQVMSDGSNSPITPPIHINHRAESWLPSRLAQSPYSIANTSSICRLALVVGWPP